MTTARQKESEHLIGTLYTQKVLGTSGSLTHSEAPDLIFAQAGTTIGIEVTAYHQPVYDGHKFKRSNVEAEWENLRALVRKYREQHPDLERLSVQLDFKDLLVPPRRDHLPFIQAIHAEINAAKSQLTTRILEIRIKKTHPNILNQFLKVIALRVCKARGLDWDSSLSYSPVGTSDEELCEILSEKLKLQRRDGIAELHLVVDGAGGSGGTYIGMLPPEWLEGYSAFNQAIERSAYEAVTILNYEYACMWRRGAGWAQVPYKSE